LPRVEILLSAEPAHNQPKNQNWPTSPPAHFAAEIVYKAAAPQRQTLSPLLPPPPPPPPPLPPGHHARPSSPPPRNTDARPLLFPNTGAHPSSSPTPARTPSSASPPHPPQLSPHRQRRGEVWWRCISTGGRAGLCRLHATGALLQPRRLSGGATRSETVATTATTTTAGSTAAGSRSFLPHPLSLSLIFGGQIDVLSPSLSLSCQVVRLMVCCGVAG
jgi:hypothetical protein